MSYVRVESSVPRNRKFLSAGPAASWLWLCGLTYCQEGLTDGFIPREALSTLGVTKSADVLAARLVVAGLWHVEHDPRGWRVHDYLDHNKPAAEVHRIKTERKQGGNLGGRPKVNLPSGVGETFPVDVDVAASVVVAVAADESVRETTAVLDVPFREFQAAYPKHRPSGGMCERLYFQAVQSQKTTPVQMLAALENHKQSEQWQDPKHVPNMEKWLEREQWTVTMPPRKVVGVTERTAGNADAIRQFVERHHGRS